jgi:hypothetical protein
MMLNEELMSAGGGDALSDENDMVKASEEGLEWEVLTSPPAPDPETRGGGRAGTPTP